MASSYLILSYYYEFACFFRLQIMNKIEPWSKRGYINSISAGIKLLN